MSKKPASTVPVTQRRSITSLNRPPPKQGERRRDSKQQVPRSAEESHREPKASAEERKADAAEESSKATWSTQESRRSTGNVPVRARNGSAPVERSAPRKSSGGAPDVNEFHAKSSVTSTGEEVKTMQARVSPAAVSADQGAFRRSTLPRSPNATAQAGQAGQAAVDAAQGQTTTQRLVLKQKISIEEGKFLMAPPQKTGIHESVRRDSDTSYDIIPPEESRSARINRMRQNLESRTATGSSSPSSAFDLPPLSEGLDSASRYSSLMTVPSETFSTESMKLKSALKQGERTASKRGIRFDESTTFVSSTKTIGVVLEKPAIIWMVGPPAVGKTTLTKYIQKELLKRQTDVSVLNWSTFVTKGNKTQKGTIDMSDEVVVNGLLTGMIEKKKNPMDVLITDNFPLNINQAQLFENQFRSPDLILSLTASQKTLQARITDVARKPVTNQVFSSRTEKFYRNLDPVLQRYKGIVVTLDAEQPIATMWERVLLLMVNMEVMHSRAPMQMDHVPHLR